MNFCRLFGPGWIARKNTLSIRCRKRRFGDYLHLLTEMLEWAADGE